MSLIWSNGVDWVIFRFHFNFCWCHPKWGKVLTHFIDGWKFWNIRQRSAPSGQRRSDNGTGGEREKLKIFRDKIYFGTFDQNFWLCLEDQCCHLVFILFSRNPLRFLKWVVGMSAPEFRANSILFQFLTVLDIIQFQTR